MKMKGLTKMKRKKTTVVFLILSLIVFFGCLANIIVVNAIEIPSEENTTEFSATVKSVEMIEEGAYESWGIYLEEYYGPLTVSTRRGVIDMDDLNSMKPGQIVFFRIENVWLKNFEEQPFHTVVSLRTEDREIASLSDCVERIMDRNNGVTIVGVISMLISLLIFIHCILLFKGINVFHRKKTL